MENYFSEDYCYIVDSGMNITKIRQSKMQELLDKKEISPLDIKEQVGSENITDLIDYLLVEFKSYDKFDIQLILNYLNDIMCDFESNEEYYN